MTAVALMTEREGHGGVASPIVIPSLAGAFESRPPPPQTPVPSDVYSRDGRGGIICRQDVRLKSGLNPYERYTRERRCVGGPIHPVAIKVSALRKPRVGTALTTAPDGFWGYLGDVANQ